MLAIVTKKSLSNIDTDYFYSLTKHISILFGLYFCPCYLRQVVNSVREFQTTLLVEIRAHRRHPTPTPYPHVFPCLSVVHIRSIQTAINKKDITMHRTYSPIRVGLTATRALSVTLIYGESRCYRALAVARLRSR